MTFDDDKEQMERMNSLKKLWAKHLEEQLLKPNPLLEILSKDCKPLTRSQRIKSSISNTLYKIKIYFQRVAYALVNKDWNEYE